MTTKNAPSPGVICPDKLYAMSAAKALTGWGDSAVRSARRAGLRILYLHSRTFVRGVDLIQYIEQNAALEAPSARRKTGGDS